MADGRQAETEIAREKQEFGVPADSTIGGAIKLFQLEPGQIVDERFCILNEIGRGGMGIVYRVRQVVLDREMALKTISGDNVSETTWRRFQQEAKAASMLDHPNLITVHDCGLLEGRHPYFVMDLVDGITLADRIRETGPLPVEQVLSLFIQVCFGLGYAHELGIVHRDIKPSNIILVRPHEGSTSFNVKIVDFGIAKLASHETSDGQGLTRTGEIFGSPLYMSPEQCLGISVDSRSDIYAVGCVLFESLAGLPPLLGNTALSTMMKHQSDKPPTLKEATLGIEFPPALEKIVARLLEKDPAQRYQTLQAVAHDLSLLQQGISSPLIKEERRKTGAPAKRSFAIAQTAGLCLLSAALSAFCAYSFMEIAAKERSQKEQAAAVKAETTAELIQISPKMQPATERAISDQSEITSIVLDRNGNLVRRFNFSERMGMIYWSGGERAVVARGEIDVPLKADVRLTVQNPGCVQNPHFFSRFGREDLAEVCLSKNEGVRDETLEDIGHVRTLRVVELANCFVGDKIIDRLNELPSLQTLCIDKTNITAAGLSRLKRIRLLSGLFASGFKGMSEILPMLENSTSLNALYLEKTALRDKDMQYIKSLRNLCVLQIDQNPAISDNGIALLKRHKTLFHLDIAKTSCTENVLDTLKTMPQLKYVRISTGMWSNAAKKLFERELPKVKLIEDDFDKSSWQTQLQKDFLENVPVNETSGQRDRLFLDLR